MGLQWINNVLFLKKNNNNFEVGHNIYKRIFCEALLNAFYSQKDRALFFVANARVIQKDKWTVSQSIKQESRPALLWPFFSQFPPAIFP